MNDKQDKAVILAVDDTPENLDVVKGILGNDYVVRAATSGAMALKIVEAPFSSILVQFLIDVSANFDRFG